MSHQAMKIDDEAWDRVVELTDGAASVCYQCGTCTATCPWGKLDDEPLTVRRIMREAQIGADGDGDGEGDEGSDLLYKCLTCRACEVNCPRDVDIVDAMIGLREGVVREDGQRPPGRLEGALWGVYEDENPWERPPSERDDWLEKVPDDVDVQVGGEADVLLYVGCVPSYDPALQGVPAAVLALLDVADVDVAVLGEDEVCCGDVVRQTGEDAFFEDLAGQNAEAFAEVDPATVVTISPHCTETFAEDYDLGAEVEHYTTFLADLVESGDLELGSTAKTVTYHDPCYLARGEDVIDEPRRLLDAIGAEVVEMDESRHRTLCCGGGGGNMWVESDPEERFADRRAKQAGDTGAEELITACPYCVQNLEDGVKKEGVDVPVRDLATVLYEAAGNAAGGTEATKTTEVSD